MHVPEPATGSVPIDKPHARWDHFVSSPNVVLLRLNSVPVETW